MPSTQEVAEADHTDPQPTTKLTAVAVDDRGRRWHGPRPEPLGVADVIRWLVLWVVVVILLFVPRW
jgi:hypothetical protein